MHIGMQFAGFPEVRERLREARFQCLERIVKTAEERQCNLIVISGDLFHTARPAKKDLARATHILEQFRFGPVAVLPGNHDFLSGGDAGLWQDFQKTLLDNIIILDRKAPFNLARFNVGAVLYPCPCESKHSAENAVGWIREIPLDESNEIRIGVAHGSLEGVSPDFDMRYFPMTEAELNGFGLDLWLLGHTHIRYPKNPGPSSRIFFPGTAEPDGFDCDHKGSAWIIEIDEEKKITAEPIETGKYFFVHDNAELSSGADVQRLAGRYKNEEFKNALVKLKIAGRLPDEEFKKAVKVSASLSERLTHLILDSDGLSEEITIEKINSEFAEGSFPHVLLYHLCEDGDGLALQTAFEIVSELRKK